VWQTGTNLANPPKYAADAYSVASWTVGYRSGNNVISGGKLNNMPAYEQTGNGGVPPNAVVLATVDVVNRALVFKYDNRAGWVQRTTNFSQGWNFPYGDFPFSGSPGDSVTLTPVGPNLNWQPGDTLTGTGSCGTITGTVTSYSTDGSGTLIFTINTVTGSGDCTMNVVANSTAGPIFPGSLYDQDLNFLQGVLVKDANGNKPTLGVFYQA